MNNNKQHRTIKAVPTQVFDRLELNKQKINHVYYELYKNGTIVIKKPELSGMFSNKLFNFDPEPYVIVDNVGRKYRLVKLVDLIDNKVVPSKRHYQPYEIRAFKTGQEFLKYLNSELIKNSLIKLYGKDRYNTIIRWFQPKVDKYTDWIKKHI
jgi:hypothetical protein